MLDACLRHNVCEDAERGRARGKERRIRLLLSLRWIRAGISAVRRPRQELRHNFADTD